VRKFPYGIYCSERGVFLWLVVAGVAEGRILIQTDRHAKMTGQTISHYRVLEKLGEGGMGVVYRAEDTKLKRTVALKFLPKQLEEHRERFLREAQAAASLNHPNICTVFEVDEEHGFLAMELVEGKTVKEKIAERPLPLAEAIDIAVQVCAGLQHAHERGIVHRDIKPANLIVTPQGAVKIMDFGLAQVGDRTRITKTGASMGTPAYMSPEQATGEDVDRRSDLWSIAVTLYEMIAGHATFKGDNDAALAYSIVHTTPEPLTALRAGLPPAIDRVFAKALEKRPSERYQHAADFRVDLDSLLSGAGARVSNRRGWFIGAAAAVAGGAGVWLWPKKTGSENPGQKAKMYAVIPSPNAEAAEAFERANVLVRVQFDVPKALSLLDHALKLDPDFHEAAAMRSFCEVLIVEAGLSNDPAVLYRAETEARELEHKIALPRIYDTLGAAYYFLGRRSQMPEVLEKALQKFPSSVGARIWYGRYHMLAGNYATVRKLMNELLNIDPLFFPARIQIAEIRRQQGDYAGALIELDRIFDQDTRNFHAATTSSLVYANLGDLAAASKMLDRVNESLRGSYIVRLFRAILLARGGDRRSALKTMDADVRKFAQFLQWTCNAAEFYAILGDREKAVDLLESAVRGGDERADWFEINPFLSNLREHPRFRQILASIRQRRRSV